MTMFGAVPGSSSVPSPVMGTSPPFLLPMQKPELRDPVCLLESWAEM